MRIIALILLCASLVGPAKAETPTMRVAVLKFGTVNWLMNTIAENGLDAKHGYKLEVVPLAGKAATTIALQAGDADAIVTDWVWAMRQREQGVPYKFLPYSRALGALMVRPDAGVASICDLKGKSDRRRGRRHRQELAGVCRRSRVATAGSTWRRRPSRCSARRR